MRINWKLFIGRAVIAMLAWNGFMEALRWLSTHLPIEAGAFLFVGYILGVLFGLGTLVNGVFEEC